MKNKLIAILAAFTAFVVTANAGQTVVATQPVVVNEPSGFVAKAFAASVIEDTDTYAFGGGVSLEVPVFYNLKLEAVGSVFEDELYTVGGNVLWYAPVAEDFSVYALAGGSYEFETDQWTVLAGGGVKYSLNSRLSLFADGAYNWTVEDSAENGVVVVRVGVGFEF